jgi:Lrp/AsnC family transcriptional regulator, leucine-responsive regulatory protein
MTSLDPTDRKILSILQIEGRLSNAELARRIGLTPPPTLERVKRLEREGVIRGYAARLDGPSLGLGLTVFASVSLAMHQLGAVEEFEAAVRDLPEVLECHHTTGEADFLLKLKVADTGAYEQLLRGHLIRLPGVQRIQSSVVLSTAKDETPLPLSNGSEP